MYKILIFILLLGEQVMSQNVSDTVFLNNLPLKGGYILKYKEYKYGGVIDPANFIYIYSKSREVIAIKSGVITTQFNIGEDDFFGIKSNDTLIVYGKIRSPKKKGDYLMKGDKIGELIDSSRNHYTLMFSIGLINKNLNYLELYDFLKFNYENVNK